MYKQYSGVHEYKENHGNKGFGAKPVISINSNSDNLEFDTILLLYNKRPAILNEIACQTSNFQVSIK